MVSCSGFAALCKYVQKDTPVPFNYLRQVLELARHIGAQRILPKCLIDPTCPETTVMLPDCRLSLSDICVAVDTLIRTAHKQMILVLRDMDVQKLDHLVNMGSVRQDHWQCETESYSFLTDKENNLWSKHSVTLCQHLIGQEAMTAGSAMSEGGNLEILWDHITLSRWQSQAEHLLDLLLTILHLTSGQPARASEVTTIRLRNTGTGTGMRSIFLINGVFAFIQNYHKMRSIVETDTCIARFPPVCINDLLLKYLVLVRPMEWYVFSIGHAQIALHICFL
jgi:hypothetical protein